MISSSIARKEERRGRIGLSWAWGRLVRGMKWCVLIFTPSVVRDASTEWNWQLPPQWLNIDLRGFDCQVLGKFHVIMADPPWDIHMSVRLYLPLALSLCPLFSLMPLPPLPPSSPSLD